MIEEIIQLSNGVLTSGVPVQILVCEVHVTKDVLLDQARVLLAERIAFDLAELHRDGDISSEDRFLRVRDGTKKGNHKTIKVHAVQLCEPEQGKVDEGIIVYKALVAIS